MLMKPVKSQHCSIFQFCIYLVCLLLTLFLNDKCLPFQAKSVEEKRLWAHQIKRLILENHNTIIPQQVNNSVPRGGLLFVSATEDLPRM